MLFDDSLTGELKKEIKFYVLLKKKMIEKPISPIAISLKC